MLKSELSKIRIVPALAEPNHLLCREMSELTFPTLGKHHIANKQKISAPASNRTPFLWTSYIYSNPPTA
jgi:hypothetical protein